MKDFFLVRDCICADPENCTVPVPGYRCRRRFLPLPVPLHPLIGEQIARDCARGLDNIAALVVGGTLTPHQAREVTASARMLERLAAAYAKASAPLADAEVSRYRDTFRAELDKRMDTRHPSASPSTESHQVALRQFLDGRIGQAPTGATGKAGSTPAQSQRSGETGDRFNSGVVDSGEPKARPAADDRSSAESGDQRKDKGEEKGNG